MIYTVGKTEIYERAFKDNAPDPTYKLGCCERDGEHYPGGSVWQTREEAQRIANVNIGFSVYSVDALWGVDTRPSALGEWHDLLRDAVIIESMKE